MTVNETLSTMEYQDYTDYIHDPIQFVIDENLRTVSIPSDGVVIGVVGDKNVNRVNFKMDRYYNGFDMVKFVIRIDYINAAGDPNYYAVDDLFLEEDKMLFTWLVDSDATAYEGVVKFVVRLIKADGSGVITQAFDTSISEVKVLNGIVVDNYITPEEATYLLSHLKSDLDEYAKNIVIPSIPEDYTSLCEDVYKLQCDVSKKCELLRNINVHMNTEDHTISINFLGKGIECLIYTKDRWYAPLNLNPDMTDVVINYTTQVIEDMSIVLVYDLTDCTFKLRQMGYYKFVDTDVVLFFAFMDSQSYKVINNVINPYCNNIYLDGVLQVPSSSVGIRSDINTLQGDVSKKCELLRNINVHMNTEDHTIAINFDGKGIECLIYAKDRWYAPLNLNPEMADMAIDYSTLVNSSMSIVLLYDLKDCTFKLKQMRYEKFVDTDILLFFAFINYPSYKVVDDVFNAYCNNIYLDGVSQAPSIVRQVKQEINMSAFNRHTCRIFKRVVCCGDSYTSGYIKLNGEEVGIATNEEFAWPHFMSTLTGNEWINCGCSGCNVLTWHTHERGLPAAQTKGKVQAYVIGLMINDVSDTSRAVELGTVEDIGADCTATQTYYAGLSSIIRNLNAISPNAKIFVNTCPKTGNKYTLYNQAVRDIVNTYKDTYPVHCIDLEEVKDYYTNSSLTGDYMNSHYTAIGYEQFAEIYEYVLSDYINNHISDFQNVHEIEY